MKQIVLAVLMVALPGWALAQEISAQGQHAGELAKIAYECANLAVFAKHEIDAVRLARFAHENSIAFSEEFIALVEATEGKPLGPMHDYIVGVSPEFWAGLSFAAASTAITKFIENEHPYSPEAGYDTISLLRQFAAEDEFQRRNCKLIGQ